MDDDDTERAAQEWMGARRRGCRLELSMSVLKARTKPDLLRRKGKQPFVLCLLSNETETASDCELVFLKRTDHGIEEDLKRTCRVSELQSLKAVEEEGAPRANKGDYLYGVLIASKRRTDSWLCVNLSERRHLVITIQNIYLSCAGNALKVTGLDEHPIAATAAGPEEQGARNGASGKSAGNGPGSRRAHHSNGHAADGEDDSVVGSTADRGGTLGADEEEELMKMLQNDLRMDEIPKYKQQLSEDLALLQDATIHAALSSAELFSSLQHEMDNVVQGSERLVDMINASDVALKGVCVPWHLDMINAPDPALAGPVRLACCQCF